MTIRRVSLELACWYLAVLIPTLAFKFEFVSLAYVDGFDAALQTQGLAPGSFEWWTHGLLFFAGDPLELLVAVVALYAAGRLLGPSGSRLLMAVMTLSSLLILGANHTSYREIGSLLTIQTVENVLHWATSDPGSIPDLVTPRGMLFVSLATLWTVLPILVTRAAHGWPRGFLAAVPQAIAVACLAIALLARGFVGTPIAGSDSLLRGYWSNAALTFLGDEGPNPLRLAAGDPADVRGSFRRLAYPSGFPAEPDYLLDVPPVHRHIVVVVLETAPRKYYPITGQGDLPAFRRMSEQAIISDLHYAAAPVTTPAIYSILSGTYPRPGALPTKYGEFETDGLATVLAERGYEATYVDSYVLDWLDRGDDRLVRNLGFARIVDASTYTGPPSAGFYERTLRQEEISFDRAIESILGAESRGRKALVCIATAFGHSPWRAEAEHEAAPGSEKIARLTGVLDGLF
ncbi:MAG: sulfatase-like hydrolase/transferase, partial [Candidatus Binatia bacterium]